MWQSGDRFLEGVLTMVTPPPPEPEVDVRSLVVRQLQGASELTTAIFAMEGGGANSQRSHPGRLRDWLH